MIGVYGRPSSMSAIAAYCFESISLNFGHAFFLEIGYFLCILSHLFWNFFSPKSVCQVFFHLATPAFDHMSVLGESTVHCSRIL